MTMDIMSVPMSAGMSLLVIWLLAVLAQTAAWWWQKRHRNAGLVDVIWSASVGGGLRWLWRSG